MSPIEMGMRKGVLNLGEACYVHWLNKTQSVGILYEVDEGGNISPLRKETKKGVFDKSFPRGWRLGTIINLEPGNEIFEYGGTLFSLREIVDDNTIVIGLSSPRNSSDDEIKRMVELASFAI